MCNNALQTFSLRSSDGYLKRSWDDECIVYVTDARETHLLTAPCAHVMGLLEQGPATFERLRSKLRMLVDDAQDQEVVDLLSEIVATLAKIGLVEAREDVS